MFLVLPDLIFSNARYNKVSCPVKLHTHTPPKKKKLKKGGKKKKFKESITFFFFFLQ